MAGHLLVAGYELVVYDIVPEAMARLAASPAASCREVAARSDVVISMVPDSPDVEAVALGRDGIIAAARPGLVHIDMSTVSPQTAIRVGGSAGQKGVRCLDAPVSGARSAPRMRPSPSWSAARRTSSPKPGHPGGAGQDHHHCGGPGAGQTVKACNQIQVALNFVGMAEALVFGVRAGVDPAIILKVLGGGYAQTPRHGRARP